MAWTAMISLLLVIAVYLLATSLLGAAALSSCCRLAKLRALSFVRLWKAYLAAVAYGLLLGLGFSFTLSSLNPTLPAVLALQMTAVGLTHLLVVTLLLGLQRDFRALLALAIAVCVTNLATVAVLQSLSLG